MDTNRTSNDRLKLAARRRAAELRHDALDSIWLSLQRGAAAAWKRLSGRHVARAMTHPKVARQFR